MELLIIEDDAALSEGICLALGGEGKLFTQCFSFKEAREAFGEKAFDLVILDLNLPDGSGFDFLKEVRKTSQVPILILTANDMEMNEVMGLELGADDFMSKPFSLAVLPLLCRVREQAQIFSRFYRSPRVQKQEGVGIGLYLTREILERGGGFLKASSKSEKGSIFSIYLPRE